MTTKREDGGDFLLGNVGLKAPRPAAKIRTTGELDIDAAEAFLDSKKDGEKLRAGLDGATSALAALRSTGLTGECLVVLVTAKCANNANGKPIADDTVKRVLEALFRLGEYTR